MCEIDANGPIFNLARFPNICRLCLQAKSPEVMLSTQNIKDENGFSLIELLDELTFAVPDDLKNHLPHSICTICYQIFEFVFKYKQKINMLLKFMVAVVEVKMGQKDSLVELFKSDNEYLSTIFKELNICHRDELDAEELIQDLERQEAKELMDEQDEPVNIKTENEETSYTNVDQVYLAKLRALNPLEEYEEKPQVSSCLTEFLDTEFTSDPGNRKRKTPSKKNKNRYEFVSMENYSDEDENENENDDEVVSDDNATVEVIYGAESNSSDEDETKDESMNSSLSPSKKTPRRRSKIKSEELLQCEKCKFKTFFSDTFENHMERHTNSANQRAWKCKMSDCNALFTSKLELSKHKLEKHSKYICDICGLVLKHKYTLEIHLRRHKGESKYPCKYCATSYFTSNELKLHTSVVHMTTADFQCTSCGLSFKNKKSLILHERSHSEDRNFQCSMCDLAFKTSAHLRRHHNGVHRAIKYNCEYCTMTYGRKDKLRMHMERAHNIQTYFTCEVCLKSFMSNAKLEEHKIHHKNPKELECGVCLAAYLSKEDFDNHLCISYRENYVCCNRDFKYHLYYNKHMFLAHGIKTNARVKPAENILTGCARAARKHVERCPKCDKTFSTRKLKKEHVVICGTEMHLLKIHNDMLAPDANSKIVETIILQQQQMEPIHHMYKEEHLQYKEDDKTVVIQRV